MTGRVAVIGSANADLVVEVDRRPAPGETVLGSDLMVLPGGKGANQAVAAARLGAAVTFVGCVGDDGNGQMLRRSLSSAGVDLGALATVPAPTASALIMVTPDGENAIIVAPGANRHVTPALLDGCRESWATADVLVLQLEVPMESVAHAAVAAAGTGARVVVNAAPAAPLPDPVLAVCDPLVVNESEAAFLLRQAGRQVPAAAEAVARGLLALGPRSVVVTLGGDGCVHVEPGATPVRTPAHRVEVVDTTGAGDAFVGALAADLAAGVSLGDGVARATAVAAHAVGRPGAQGSYPTAAEVGR